MKTEKATVKKLYVVPEIRSFDVEACVFFATSGIDQERYNYLCPYIPETRCREYNYSVRRKHGIFSKVSKVPWHYRVSKKGEDECPNKSNCEKYLLYLKLTNEKQH